MQKVVSSESSIRKMLKWDLKLTVTILLFIIPAISSGFMYVVHMNEAIAAQSEKHKTDFVLLKVQVDDISESIRVIQADIKTSDTRNKQNQEAILSELRIMNRGKHGY